MTLDDDLYQDSDIQPVSPSKVFNKRGIFQGLSLGSPIVYNTSIKKFIPGFDVSNKNNAFLGWYLNFDDETKIVDVLYRGFLLKEPLHIPFTLQSRNLQTYINEQFKIAAKSISENMPRVKKLKRLNLKMMTYEQAIFLYRNIDAMIRKYEDIYDFQKAGYLKAQITTSSIYVNDNGIIKVFDMQSSEFTLPELETEAYFLAYFSFENKLNY